MLQFILELKKYQSSDGLAELELKKALSSSSNIRYRRVHNGMKRIFDKIISLTQKDIISATKS